MSQHEGDDRLGTHLVIWMHSGDDLRIYESYGGFTEKLFYSSERFMTSVTLSGANVSIDRTGVAAVIESTPETRERDRAIESRLVEMEPADDPPKPWEE